MSQRYSSLDEVIKANNLFKDCNLPLETMRHHAKMAMVTNSLAYVLADAAESFLMDSDLALNKLNRNLTRETKQNFKNMASAVHTARRAAQRAAKPMYATDSGYTDDACIDSDWFYHFLMLLDDRVGVNPQKTHLLLEFLLNMPSEGEGLFNPKMDDFIP